MNSHCPALQADGVNSVPSFHSSALCNAVSRYLGWKLREAGPCLKLSHFPRSELPLHPHLHPLGLTGAQCGGGGEVVGGVKVP